MTKSDEEDLEFVARLRTEISDYFDYYLNPENMYVKRKVKHPTITTSLIDIYIEGLMQADGDGDDFFETVIQPLLKGDRVK